MAQSYYDLNEITNFIISEAKRLNIDPDIALRVAKSEGLGEGIWQSNIVNNGVREPSYGPFQLNTRPGAMGDRFRKATNLDPADPANVKATITYALEHAATGGWGAWHGWKGDPMAGIKGGPKTYGGPDEGVTGKGSVAAGTTGGTGTSTAATSYTTPPVPSQYALKPEKTAGEKLGEAVAGLGPKPSQVGMGNAPQMAPVDYYGAGQAVPSVFRAQLQPTMVGAGMGGGGDMRQLLAQLMQGGRGANLS